MQQQLKEIDLPNGEAEPSRALALLRDRLGAQEIDPSADSAVCPNCRETYDSMFHAVQCLGEDPAGETAQPHETEGEPPCHHEECWDALAGRCLEVVAS